MRSTCCSTYSINVPVALNNPAVGHVGELVIGLITH